MTTTCGRPNSGDSVVGSVGEDVERGAADVPDADRVGQRVLVDDAAPGHVDDADAGLGLGEQVVADQPDGLLGLEQVDA